LRRIQQQEALDALETDIDADRALFQKMTQADEQLEDEGLGAFNSWLVDTLRFGAGYRDVKDAVRYSFSLRRPTLLPLNELLQTFRPCVDMSYEQRSKDEVPFRVCTFSRSAAESAHIELVRIGHPLVDSLESLLRYDERGRVFAMWRVQAGWYDVPRLFLRFDFVVEADVARAEEVARVRSVSRFAIERRATEALPPRVFPVFLDDGLLEVTDSRLLGILRRPYVARERGGADMNIRHDRWAAVDAACAVADWADLCARGRRTAERVLRTSNALAAAHSEAASRHRTVASEIVQRIESRMLRMAGATRAAEERSASLEREVGEAIAAGIEAPSVRVEAVGAIYVAGGPPAAAEPA
jgi:ATP-dependent helicase HepA